MVRINRCVCLHHYQEHKYKGGACLVYSCYCEDYETNRVQVFNAWKTSAGINRAFHPLGVVRSARELERRNA